MSGRKWVPRGPPPPPPSGVDPKLKNASKKLGRPINGVVSLEGNPVVPSSSPSPPPPPLPEGPSSPAVTEDINSDNQTPPPPPLFASALSQDSTSTMSSVSTSTSPPPPDLPPPPPIDPSMSKTSSSNRARKTNMKRRSVTNLSKAKDKQESMRQLKSLLLENTYDDLTSDLWKADPKRRESQLRKDTSSFKDLPSTREDMHDDVTSTVHSKHQMSVVDEHEAGIDFFDDHAVDAMGNSFASTVSVDGSNSKPIWKGYLEKKSPSILGRWQKRFVVIGHSGKMTYRKTEEAEENSGQVPLMGTKVVWKQPKKEDDYYTLEMPSMNKKDRVFIFRTKSKMDVELITTILTETIYAQNLKKIIKLCKEADGEDSDDEDMDEDVGEDADHGDGDGGEGEEGEELDASVSLTRILDYNSSEDRTKLTSYVSETNSQTLLHVCATSGSYKCASIILKYMQPELVDLKDNAQMTAAHYACLNKYNKTALVVLNCPHFDPTIKGESGDTYLNFASKCKRQVVRKLIELGVNVLETNVMGNTPLHEMAGYNNVEGIEELVKANNEIVNIQGSKDGYTALHWAARAGALKSVDALIANGADASMPGHTGNTPLHVCIGHYVGKSKRQKESHTKSVSYHKKFTHSIVSLVNGGAQLEDLSRGGRSALAELCRIEPEFVQKKIGGEEAFKAMLEKGAKVNVRSQKGLMPLHYAAKAGNYALVKLLIDYGADVNAQGSDGETALGYVESQLKVEGAQTLYGVAFAYLNKTVTVLLEGGAIRRAHRDIAIEENTSEIIYMRNHIDGTYQMKAANIPAMVARLTHRAFYSVEDVNSFLLQYHKFTTPLQILGCLKGRFFPRNVTDTFNEDDGGSDDDENLTLLGERRSVLCFLEAWLSSNQGNPVGFEDEDSECTIFLSDFVELIMDTKCTKKINENLEPVLLPYFGDFVANMHEIQWKERWADQHEYLTIEDNRMSSNTMSTSGSVLTRGRVVDFSQYAEVADMYEKGSRPQSQKASKLLGTVEETESVKLINFSPQEIAKQLTLLVHTIFCEIPVEEFVDGRYRKVETGPNFQRLKLITNKLSFVLISAILAEEDMNARAAVIVLLIQTAENCLTVENFDMFVSIISVLGSSSIHRLKQTWARVHRILPKKWDAMQKASGGAGRGLEKKMQLLKPPCVPCIGLVLRMLINLDEEPNRLESNKDLINFHKLRKIGNVFSMIDNAKSVPYTFTPNPELIELLSKTPQYKNEDACWNRSREI
eukprot:CAMPEP_0118659514 /NCGR_PEP_ID=MMETSP0785-20121206/15154_1 /TAXON_ID=91992 /ORGANISM="Bolidomonas pacifica, Strain CCMP 1866" /LENGTH=1246 /DNA_ID=CAMNT_0006552627 /DNA_START=13 /DNA_END=3750 /DNA_ORIENTATION=-